MTRRALPPALLTALLTILALLPATSVLGAEGYEETTEAMFTFNHNGDAGCGAKDGQLVYEPNPAGLGCGYIYGAPIGEVEHRTGTGTFANVRTYTTEATFEPVILDASRTVTGVVTVSARESFCASPAPVPCVPHSGTGSGVGQIIVDVAFGGLAADASQFASPSTLGSATVEAMILPGATEVEIPYEITLPDSADVTAFRALTFSTDVHGVHLNTGYALTDGSTTVDIPTLTPIVEEAAA